MSKTPTIKQLSSRHARRLRTMNKQVLEMCADWEDLDEFNISVLTELSEKMRDVVRDLLQEDSDVGAGHDESELL